MTSSDFPTRWCHVRSTIKRGLSLCREGPGQLAKQQHHQGDVGSHEDLVDVLSWRCRRMREVDPSRVDFVGLAQFARRKLRQHAHGCLSAGPCALSEWPGAVDEGLSPEWPGAVADGLSSDR